MQTDGLTVGVDLGGTKIAAGVVDPKGEIISRVRVPTPQDPSLVACAIASAVEQVRQGWDGVQAVGVGAAGYVDRQRSTVRFAPNLGWQDEPLRVIVEHATKLPVVVENDANAAAWGEFVHGAGADCEDMVMVTVGTGLGGGIITGGQLFRGRFGMGGEIGHYRAVPDGIPCGCGQHGCMEQYASGAAHISARPQSRRDRSRSRRRSPHSGGGGSPDGIQGRHVTEAAMAGDPLALDLFEETGRWVGQALADLASILDPAVFVIGGGLSETGELIARPAGLRTERHSVVGTTACTPTSSPPPSDRRSASSALPTWPVTADVRRRACWVMPAPARPSGCPDPLPGQGERVHRRFSNPIQVPWGTRESEHVVMVQRDG